MQDDTRAVGRQITLVVRAWMVTFVAILAAIVPSSAHAVVLRRGSLHRLPKFLDAERLIIGLGQRARATAGHGPVSLCCDAQLHSAGVSAGVSSLRAFF
jgi:hypothetical protein